MSIKCQDLFFGTYAANSTDAVKARHSEDFKPKKLFY